MKFTRKKYCVIFQCNHFCFLNRFTFVFTSLKNDGLVANFCRVWKLQWFRRKKIIFPRSPIIWSIFLYKFFERFKTNFGLFRAFWNYVLIWICTQTSIVCHELIWRENYQYFHSLTNYPNHSIISLNYDLKLILIWNILI